MLNNNLFLNINKKKFIIHFIGIGGIGMSSLAEFLFLSGYNITGSDIYFNFRIKYLLSLGIKIYKNHSKNNILGVNLVIYSSAVDLFNSEIISAKFYGIPVLKRIEFISELLKFYHIITVIGSHGKTTTTSLVFDLFLNNNIEINCINGGNIKSINSYIYLSDSKYFLLEIDESDGIFLYLKPTYVILTNIDYDHLNNYSYKINNLIKYFINFLNNIPFYGYLIACIDNFFVNKILENNIFKCNIITYGFNKNSKFFISNFVQKNNISYFTLNINKLNSYNLIINLFGKFNVLNTVASICLLSIFRNIDFFDLQKSLYFLKGVSRRSEIIGEFSFFYNNKSYNNILFMIDYGHHPTEINYILKSIYNIWKNRKLIMVFQPHRFSRTKILFNEFSYVLSKVNILLLLNIYSANENKSDYFISSKDLLYNMYDTYGYNNCILIDKKKNLISNLLNIINDNCIVLFQGAGYIDLILFKFIDKYINN